MVKRSKLQWYGHVSRSSGLARTILQGTVKGGRKQGRQRKRWEDSMREWTGLEFGRSQRAVENREKWRKVVAKSTVVPQRPRRLIDRWWWWWWFCFYCQIPVGVVCPGRIKTKPFPNIPNRFSFNGEVLDHDRKVVTYLEVRITTPFFSPTLGDGTKRVCCLHYTVRCFFGGIFVILLTVALWTNVWYLWTTVDLR